jgi:nucleoside-diphosphate-sugar epimerase
MLAPTALILGCGYLGRRVAALLLQRGVTVYGTSRTPAKATQLASLGVRPLLASVEQLLTLASLRPAIAAASLDVYYLVPPGRTSPENSPREIAIDGLRNVLHALRTANIRRAVMASSTAVYDHPDGQRVSADTPANPPDDRGRLLLESEQLWLSAGPRFHAVRLAGLYGPGRVIGMAALRDRAPLVGNPHAWLNVIHVDDAADLLLAVMDAASPSRIELGCDNAPTPRQSYYAHLATMLNLPAPPALSDAEAAERLGIAPERLGTASKACDNTPTRTRTGWSPRYPTFREGLDSILVRTSTRNEAGFRGSLQ